MPFLFFTLISIKFKKIFVNNYNFPKKINASTPANMKFFSWDLLQEVSVIDQLRISP